jgi:uncharacterized protein
MNTLKHPFLALVSLLFVAGCATLKQPANTLDESLLWKIEGKDLETPSYLYGTIHVISQNDFFLNDATKTAFDESQEIVLELDMDDPQMGLEMMQLAGMKDGQTLDKLLDQKDYRQLDSLVQKNMGMGIAMFNNWQPILAFSLIVQEFIEGEMASYELSFVQMAQEAGKEITGLETVAEQIAAMGNISYQAQADYLAEQLDDLEDNRKLFREMVDLYKEQKIAALETYIVESSGGDAFAEHLLKDRNEKWVDRIHNKAKEGTIFFAVGAGHLAGENGVINLLRKAGFTVTAVE